VRADGISGAAGGLPQFEAGLMMLESGSSTAMHPNPRALTDLSGCRPKASDVDATGSIGDGAGSGF
jgi:hypothetical protein